MMGEFGFDIPIVVRNMILSGETLFNRDGLRIRLLRSKDQAILLSDIMVNFSPLKGWVTSPSNLLKLASKIIYQLELQIYHDYCDFSYSIELRDGQLDIMTTNYNIRG